MTVMMLFCRGIPTSLLPEGSPIQDDTASQMPRANYLGPSLVSTVAIPQLTSLLCGYRGKKE